MPVIKALRTVLSDGTKSYPIYLGYLAASDLRQIASVPSFGLSSSNASIARNVLNPPVKDWQRPLIEAKWQAIRDRFSLPGELMPNPVLLAVANASAVTVTQQNIQGQMTEIFEIDVQVPPAGQDAPLWVLDGQHRVRGVSESAHSSNSVPLVLLHGTATAAYSPQQFAKVFAEVTTYATPLNPIHEDWLRFAFKLGPYEPASAGTDTSTWKAMATVAELCERQNVGQTMDANPFHDRILFNPELSQTQASVGGFSYTAVTLRELVQQHYYDRPSSSLAPGALAEQIALALLALTRNDPTTTADSAFFGDTNHRQRYLQDGFVVGVLNYLRKKGVPVSWDAVLQALKFNTASWDVTPWVVTTGGNSGNASRLVSNAVFENVFGVGALPPGVGDLPTFLSGDTAQVTFRVSALTASGRPSRTSFNDTTYPINGNKALNVGSSRHVKLVDESINIGKLSVIDQSQPLSSEYSAAKLRRGIHLPAGGGTLRLLLGAEYFGGTRSELKLTLSWT
ncbi:hypothetical protein [Phycicoccus sp. 3266]|uniref:hypothetical protein n=1 Tax=Phycicoccus sp. 3266 TaxID=2817751 RepID=UPI00285A9ADE|nr:hypothetical protein [Phycicoccus sp. 3266]MDR6865260.1 hypothetical protein [Phycicoccus sp. 3266]